MGDSGGGKRSKKSKRSKRAKAAKKARLAARAKQPEAAPQSTADVAAGLSQSSQTVVIELQRAELSRLLREQQRLNGRIDQLLRLHEREQVLRQQMQAALDKLAAQRALPRSEDSGDHDEAERRQLAERVDRAEGKFAALQAALARLVAVLERRAASAR